MRDRDGWASLAIVGNLRSGRVSGTHGYAHAADGTILAVASHPSAVNAAVQAFLAGHEDSEHRPPAAFLVQVDRRSSAYEVTFAHEAAARWK